MENLTMEYESKIKEIKILIYNISKLGIDCTSYSEILGKLNTNFYNELTRLENNTKMDINSKNKSSDKIYTKYLEKLNQLKLIITHNKIYYDMKKELENINAKLRDDISIFDLSICSDELEKCVESIRKYNSAYFKEKNEIINELYRTIYKVIKLEISHCSTSLLLDYCKINNIGLPYLNELVLNDINALKNYSPKINDYFSDFSSTDDYLDDELLCLLVKAEMHDKHEKNSSDIELLINEKKREINKLRKKISEESDIKFESKVKNGKKIARYTISLLLSLGFVTGVLKSTQNVKSYNYKTTYTTYSDDELSEESVYEKNDNHDNEVLIRVEEPYKKTILGTYQRKVDYTYIENGALANLDDYLELISNEEIDFKTTREYKKFLDDKDNYTDSITKITQIDIDYNDYTVEDATIKQTLCYALLALLVLIHDGFGSVMSLYSKNKDYKELSFGTPSYIYYLVYYIKRLQKELNISNEELKALSTRLGYKENELEYILKEQDKLNQKYSDDLNSLFRTDKNYSLLEIFDGDVRVRTHKYK